ncbi:MAG: hypothetical protein GY898_13715 [Proteobacteria bacterium]|nr:hypothetical protein [Pseudomonadota bacterium]
MLLLVACAAPTEPEPTGSSTDLVCDRGYAGALTRLAEGAEDKLDVAQWELFVSSTTDRVVEDLAAAAARGVRVRVLLDETIDDNITAIARLEDLGIEARTDGSESTKLHVKMLIADDGAAALVGSTNWSASSIDINRECNLRLEGDAARYLAGWYDSLWDDPHGRDAPAIAQLADATTVALVDDDLLPALVDRIDAATERVDFTLYATYLQPTNLDAPAMQVFGALGDAAGRGVPVRGVADWSNWNDTNNASNTEAVQWLRDRGVEIRWDRTSINMHAKTFAIDDVVQIQSANVSTSGFETNREGGAWTADPDVLTDFDAWYAGLWGESTEEPPL